MEDKVPAYPHIKAEEVRIGDIYRVIHGRCTYLEVVEYNGKMCFRSFIESPPYLPVQFTAPSDVEYIGNGLDSPEVRKHFECLMKVDSWIQYGQTGHIPKTGEYLNALKAWEQLALQGKNSPTLSTIYQDYQHVRDLFQYMGPWKAGESGK